MPYNGTADPAQLTILSTALEEHCSERGILDATAREKLAELVFSLYSRGVRDIAGLKQALAGAQEERRYG
jgi:hypothetical protein